MGNDRHGKRVKVGDRVKITGTVMELFQDGKCSVEMDYCSKRTRCVAPVGNVELELPAAVEMPPEYF